MSEELDENGNKVIFLGESFVGKTNLIKISLGKKFDPQSLSTWATSSSPREFVYNKQKYIFNLWDTIGQEKYRALTKIFFNHAIIVILVYDITQRNTFTELDYWLEQVRNELSNDYILAIVANKSDLYSEEEVSENEGKEYAKNNGAKFKLTSAKENPLSFVQFLEELFIEYLQKKNQNIQNRPRGISLAKNEQQNNIENENKKCC